MRPCNIYIVATLDEIPRMSEPERQIAHIMADAGIRTISDWARLALAEDPGLGDYTTIYRCLKPGNRRRDFRIMRALAKAADVDADTLFGILATAGYLGQPDWPMADESDALAVVG